MMTIVGTTFERKIPPLPVRLGFGAAIDGIIGPVVRTLERLGYGDRVFAAMKARQRKSLVANNPFRNYLPTRHDVFVATYVKSGTNWMMQIAHQIVFHGRGDFDHVHSVVSWPDTLLMGPLRGYAIPLEDPSVWKVSPESKRVIKTHYDWEWLPYSGRARYILVIRDPKDVLVSSYLFFVKHGPLRRLVPSLEIWLRLFLSENFPVAFLGSWAANAAGYWAQRHRPNVLICSFKSMKTDLIDTVRKVAHFLDVKVSDAVLGRVCEKSSFEYMKGIDDKFRVWKLIPWAPDQPMIRKGVHGGSSELLSAEQQRQVDEHCIGQLRRLGSDFPYAEFCDVSPQQASVSGGAVR
jgi:Sulfotransferase domain